MNNYWQQKLRLTSVLLMSAALTACAGLSAGNIFSHYSAQNKDVYQAVQAGQFQNAIGALPESRAGDILDNFEKGRVYFLAQQYAKSKKTLDLSDKAVRKQQDKAKISISTEANNVGALALNDNITEYEPAEYELGFLHYYLGLNYIKQNDLEGALVEMRRANQVQERARKERQASLLAAQKDAQSKGISPNVGSILSNYPDAGGNLQSVQNAGLMFLSGLLYEASNDPNSAYVEYRRALAVMPRNQQIIDRTMYLAKELGMRQDLTLLKKQYRDREAQWGQRSHVIVIEEQGIVRAMQSWRLDIPTRGSGGTQAIYSLALPYYPNQTTSAYAPLKIDGVRLNSSQLTNVNLMAQQSLTEKMPTIVIRQVLRIAIKDQLRQQVAKDNDVGSLIFSAVSAFTEQPDTRSWETLPATINSASHLVSAGKHTLDAGTQRYSFDVPKGQTVLVWVSRQGSSTTIWHKQLGSL